MTFVISSSNMLDKDRPTVRKAREVVRKFLESKNILSFVADVSCHSSYYGRLNYNARMKFTSEVMLELVRKGIDVKIKMMLEQIDENMPVGDL